MTSRQKTRQGAWGILLAGGDGTRLQSLTARIEGDARPKQFCRVLGDESLLAQTRRRISPLFDAGKTITVVTKKHEPFYSRELSDWPATRLIVQPESRGTGVAIAASILMLRDLDDDAIVATFPCDHHYRNEAAFLEVIEAGILAAEDYPGSIVLVGAEATHPETEYGWIEPAQAPPAATRFAPVRVRQFREKPSPATARDLLRRRCLWNTFVTIGRVGTFIDLLFQTAPASMLALSAGMAENDLDSSYRLVPSIDFSRDVLACQPERLVVIRDTASGWTDLGSPDRVLEMLERERIAPAWLESVRSAEMSAVS